MVHGYLSSLVSWIDCITGTDRCKLHGRQFLLDPRRPEVRRLVLERHAVEAVLDNARVTKSTKDRVKLVKLAQDDGSWAAPPTVVPWAGREVEDSCQM